ncbi:MAG: prenyltransferase/squalene oxidase repeat-containing protein [Chitinispirillia bacterium]|jgi:hypothetical protein
MSSCDWINHFSHNPVTPLLESGNYAIEYFVRRDILEESVEDISTIWELKEVQKILKKQTSRGYWKSNSANKRRNPAQNYELLETYRHTNILVNMYGMNRKHPCIEKAADYLFSCQTDEDDIRGIIGEQYAPYYNGIIVSNLNRAGYADDPRVERIIKWLLSMRQNDGGWIIGSPGCMGNYSMEERNALTTQFVGTRHDFDRDQPFGHSGTGMVIRAFATHHIYCKSSEARHAAVLLATSFFKRNNHASYQHPDNWVRFKYPFWWTDLISALDSISLIGLPFDNPSIAEALKWFIDNQLPSGLWNHSYSKIHKYVENAKTRELRLWISLAILRVFKNFRNQDVSSQKTMVK